VRPFWRAGEIAEHDRRKRALERFAFEIFHRHAVFDRDLAADLDGGGAYRCPQLAVFGLKPHIGKAPGVHGFEDFAFDDFISRRRRRFVGRVRDCESCAKADRD
jgi:hypothetical protein